MKKHTLDDTWNIILEDNPRGNKEATLKSYSDVLRYAIKPSFEKLGFKYIENFGFQEYKMWFRYLKNKKDTKNQLYSSNTLRRIYCVLSRIFDEAVKNGWIERNIVKLSDNFPVDKEKQRKVKFQTLEEFNLFMSVVDDEFWQVAFNLMFWHGLRAGELLALDLEHFDLETKKLSIEHTTTNLTLDGTKQKITSTKNYQHRIITINANCEEIFVNFIKKLHQNKKLNSKSIIFSYNHVRPMYHSAIRQALLKYYRRLEKKLGTKVCFLSSHEFGRHSIATFMRENGASAEQIAFYLGDTEDTIKKVYFHYYELKLDKKIDDFFKEIKANIKNWKNI